MAHLVAPSEPGAPLPPVGLVFDEDCQLHAPPERFNGKPAIEHAERPERTEVIWAAVVKAGLDRQCERLAPREATREEALTCHSCEHVDALHLSATATRLADMSMCARKPFRVAASCTAAA